jgi:hypothetical protein
MGSETVRSKQTMDHQSGRNIFRVAERTWLQLYYNVVYTARHNCIICSLIKVRLGMVVNREAGIQDAYARELILAPQVGLEPTTLRLTAECSTIELLRSKMARHKLAISAPNVNKLEAIKSFAAEFTEFKNREFRVLRGDFFSL